MKNGGFWLAGILGVILDQATKRWAVERLLPGPEIRLWPGVFHLTYVENTGAAWSLFEDSGEFLKWISLGVSLALMLLAIRGGSMSRWEQAGYGLVLAGAAGNGIDRFTTGYVVDFFNFVWIRFPVFNVADVAINIGVACLLIGLLGGDTKPKGSASALLHPEGKSNEGIPPHKD
ncbi:signal peptidase II [Synechococcus sp. Nb3U1]|uniref:signal peptidase II n=1 Tax=Synechococcus sp. Nb3U1 TaxID=1914529 RepID=UPI001F1E994E|nr:signal peptidase II [Synechococcus sp. Nb3U1]MCF2971100.1 signal peptidase II [Synechococcus sp. Nb3U1]